MCRVLNFAERCWYVGFRDWGVFFFSLPHEHEFSNFGKRRDEKQISSAIWRDLYITLAVFGEYFMICHHKMSIEKVHFRIRFQVMNNLNDMREKEWGTRPTEVKAKYPRLPFPFPKQASRKQMEMASKEKYSNQNTRPKRKCLTRKAYSWSRYLRSFQFLSRRKREPWDLINEHHAAGAAFTCCNRWLSRLIPAEAAVGRVAVTKRGMRCKNIVVYQVMKCLHQGWVATCSSFAPKQNICISDADISLD